MNTLSHRDGNPEKIRVLFYHRIGTDAEGHGDSADVTISTRTFRSHLRLLEKWGYSTITFQDYALYRRGALSLPLKPVIITFDDGYKDVYLHALPAMRELGMRGVIFVVGDRSMRTNVWDEGISPTYELVDEEQILEFQAAGFEIGAHSMHHIRLTDVPEPEAWEQLYEARIGLEILLNAPVHTFSYPYGLVNSAIKTMAAEAGYTLACAAFTGPPVFGSDVLEVRRIKMVDSANPVLFWFRLQSVYVHYRWLWWQCKKVALAVRRRLTELFHYQPNVVQVSTRPMRKRSVRMAKTETHS